MSTNEDETLNPKDFLSDKPINDGLSHTDDSGTEITQPDEFNNETDSNELIPLDESDESTVIMSEHKRKTIENVSEHSLEDYEFVRSNLYDTIEASQSVLETALNIAKETEAPQAIKAATDAVKSLIDSQKELIALQKEAMALSRDYEDMIFDEGEYNSNSTGGSSQVLKKNKPSHESEQTAKDSINVSMTTTQLLEMLERENDDKPDPIDVTPS